MLVNSVNSFVVIAKLIVKWALKRLFDPQNDATPTLLYPGGQPKWQRVCISGAGGKPALLYKTSVVLANTENARH